MSLDFLVIGPHPDDAEIGAGGTLALLAKRGLKTGILDLTLGELSTRGTVEERAEEAANAARALGVNTRENAGLPDGGLANTPEQRLVIIDLIRRLRPRVLVVPQAPDRHPDHTAAHTLCEEANFLAGLAKIKTEHAPHRAETVLFYHPYAQQESMPAFVQDISETFEAKLAALRCYQSQFHNPGYGGAQTFVSSPAFWEGISARAAYWGARIGVHHGEPFYARGPLALDIPSLWLK